LLDHCEIVDLLVTVNVVHNALQVLLTLVGISAPDHLTNHTFGNGKTTSADTVVFDTDELISNVLVVAEESEAFGEDHNGVALHNVSLGSPLSEAVKVVSIVFVGHSGCSVVDNLNLIEDFWVEDIDVGNHWKSSSQTDAGNVNFFEVGLLSDLLKVSKDIALNSVPHLFVGLLDLAVAADVWVNNLVGVENILPHVEDGVGVPEGQNDESRIHTQNALDVFLVLLNVVSVERFVWRVTDVAIPVEEVWMVIPTHNHGVGEEHLFHIGEGEGQCQ
jgi:hypothetical protein